MDVPPRPRVAKSSARRPKQGVRATPPYTGRGALRKAAPSGGKDGSTQHTVEKGDTLWDLSQKYLGSPWYWPKVW